MSIDESMNTYYGHHECKQFTRVKPIKFGYKMWCLNTTTGGLTQGEPVALDKSLWMAG